MSVNKYRSHVYLIPEDDADRQLALGFLGHEAVTARVFQLRSPAGGWGKVLDVFESEYVRLLRGNVQAHVVMLIDFDNQVEVRREAFDRRVPEDLKPRVFVLGCRINPESLRTEWALPWEKIGRELAQDCFANVVGRWNHPHLVHNDAEVKRMAAIVRPILFQSDQPN